MKKILLSVFVLCSSFLFLTAQSKSKTNQEYKIMSMMGVSYSTANGSGVTYKYIKEKNGVSINFIPYISGFNNTFESRTSIGLNYIRYFNKSKSIDFSIIIGGEVVTDNTAYSGKSTRINIGLGPQINIRLVPEMTLELGLGYGIYMIEKDQSARSNLSAGIGIYYNIYHK